MKKIRNMFRNILPVFGIFVALASMMTVYANEYQTTISLQPGGTYVQGYQNYTTGIPSLQFTIKYFNKYNNQNYSRINYKFVKNDGSIIINDNTYLPESIINQNEVLLPEAYVQSGKYSWTITTKVDGTTYSGFYMNPAILSTI